MNLGAALASVGRGTEAAAVLRAGGAGSPSIRRPLRRSGQITKGPVRVQRGTSRPPGSLSTSGQFASFPASSCSIGARDRLRSDHDPL